jgi:hypothetical protein
MEQLERRLSIGDLGRRELCSRAGKGFRPESAGKPVGAIKDWLSLLSSVRDAEKDSPALVRAGSALVRILSERSEAVPMPARPKMLLAFCKRLRPNYHRNTSGEFMHMVHPPRTRAWISLTGGLILAAIIVTSYIWHKRQPISLRGAILAQDSDPRKQLPIDGVTISASSDLAPLPATSDSSGLFVLKLRKLIRHGHPITLHFTHPLYRTLDVNDYVGNKLYIVHLKPLADQVTSQSQPPMKVTNVRIRYTVQAMTEVNVGSAVTTFEIQNKGNVPCNGQRPCSPDGRWKAALGAGSLDAGPGKEFHDARASCIAGPCPFTRIESDDFARAGQTIKVAVRNWSDTTTFLLEAEVFRRMITQAEHWSYPVVFGDGLSFTLPTGAESVSMEADLNGQTIIFPLGPALFLSWASCDSADESKARVYRCTLKPGYRFN